MTATIRLDAMPRKRSGDDGHAREVEEQRLGGSERHVGALQHPLDLDEQPASLGEAPGGLDRPLEERGLHDALPLAVAAVVRVELRVGAGDEAL